MLVEELGDQDIDKVSEFVEGILDIFKNFRWIHI
jgi:hypothetical protein